MFFKKKTVWYKLFDSIEAANTRLEIGRVKTLEIAKKKICLEQNGRYFYWV